MLVSNIDVGGGAVQCSLLTPIPFLNMWRRESLTVVPGRSEGVLLHTPARREDDKVSNGHPWLGTGARQHRVDRRVL